MPLLAEGRTGPGPEQIASTLWVIRRSNEGLMLSVVNVIILN